MIAGFYPRAKSDNVLHATLRDAKGVADLCMSQPFLKAKATNLSRCAPINMGSTSTSPVFGMRHRFKMIRIDARPIPTQVIQLQSGRNNSIVPLIDVDVSKSPSSIDTHNTISAGISRPLPNPAPRRINHILSVVSSLSMSRKIANRLALNIAPICASTPGKRGCLPTAALAQARRIRAFVATLGTHFSDLLHRSGGAVPGGVRALARRLCASQVYPGFGSSTWFFLPLADSRAS
jgi:hypothetical protein